MNTPAHAALNLILLGREPNRRHQAAVVFGALLPDLPMLLFYLITKVFMGIPESIIWNDLYHQPVWQNFFAIFNSIPIIGLGLVLTAHWPWRTGRLICMSMLLHVLCDLMLHNQDAHRHFFPISDWRFHSPVSYWDPNHFGTIVTSLEIAMVALVISFLWRKNATVFLKSLLLLIGGAYIAYFGYIYWAWT